MAFVAGSLENYWVAYHEAGHCVVFYLLGATIDFVRIALKNPAEGEIGIERGFCQVKSLPSHTSPREDLDISVQANLAGELATLEAFGICEGSSGDIDSCYRDFAEYVALWPGEIEESCSMYVARMKPQAEKILFPNWSAVTALATALVTERWLDGPVAQGIIMGALPDVSNY